ncbi:MAG: hypothetical protein LBI02_02165 [Opitutaceae bacterium]|jgi:hypothetical protein|nr:hypothetical protein [Opitutaceae bacterium]
MGGITALSFGFVAKLLTPRRERGGVHQEQSRRRVSARHRTHRVHRNNRNPPAAPLPGFAEKPSATPKSWETWRQASSFIRSSNKSIPI